MEGKVVIMSVVLVSFLVLGQLQVEAQQLRSCCPTTTARNVYNACRLAGGSQSICAITAGCRRLTKCPPDYIHDILENTPGKSVAYTVGDNAVLTSCCPNATARSSFNVCFATAPACASAFGCILVPGKMACPPHFPYNMLQNTVHEYCKLGCVSSVCAAITTLQDSADASEVMNGAVEKCGNACSDFCTNNKAASVITTAA